MITPNYRLLLLSLPLDILEYLSLYFTAAKAVRILIVSSGFRDTFARSVWRVVDRRVLCVDKQTCSSAVTRYGRLVRQLDLVDDTVAADLSDYAWLDIFPNVTQIGFTLQCYMNNKLWTQLHNALPHLHGLHTLKVTVKYEEFPLQLSFLATLLTQRSSNRDIQRLQYLGITVVQLCNNSPWLLLTMLLQQSAPLHIPKVRINLDGSEFSIPVPTAEEYAKVRPYLANMPALNMDDEDQDCGALQSRLLFGSDDCGKSSVWPALESAEVEVFCTSSELYDYSDITPARYPNIQRLTITMFHCQHIPDEDEENHRLALRTILLHKWSSASSMDVFGSLDTASFNRFIDLNPQLTRLLTEVPHGSLSLDDNDDNDDNDDDDDFKLDHFDLYSMFDRLPLLTSLLLLGSTRCALDSSWTTEQGHKCLHKSHIKVISLLRTEMTPKAVELLLMMPRLHYVKFSGCRFSDREGVFDMLARIQQSASDSSSDSVYSCAIRELAISMENYAAKFWTSDIVIKLIACMPKLDKLTLANADDSVVDVVKNQYPHLNITTE